MRLRCSNNITCYGNGPVLESPEIKNLFSVALSLELGITGRKNDSFGILFAVCINCPEVLLSSSDDVG